MTRRYPEIMLQRAIDAREHLLFAENFEQVIQARAGVAAGDGETRWMNQRANFYAEICGSAFNVASISLAPKLCSAAKASRTACSRDLFSAVKCFATPSGL